MEGFLAVFPEEVSVKCPHCSFEQIQGKDTKKEFVHRTSEEYTYTARCLVCKHRLVTILHPVGFTMPYIEQEQNRS